MTFTDYLHLQLESVTETTQADHTAKIMAKDNHRSDKKSNNSNTSVNSEKMNIVIFGDSMLIMLTITKCLRNKKIVKYT